MRLGLSALNLKIFKIVNVFIYLHWSIDRVEIKRIVYRFIINYSHKSACHRYDVILDSFSSNNSMLAASIPTFGVLFTSEASTSSIAVRYLVFPNQTLSCVKYQGLLDIPWKLMVIVSILEMNLNNLQRGIILRGDVSGVIVMIVIS